VLLNPLGRHLGSIGTEVVPRLRTGSPATVTTLAARTCPRRSAESDRAILLHAGGGWQKIAMLQRGGHDVAAAKSLLSQLESRQARHIVDRNRLFKELADHS
jgi:hypothetical protein